MMAPCGLLLGLYLSLSGVALASTQCESNIITNLSCNTDYNRSITCEWNSDHSDQCTVQVHKIRSTKYFVGYTSSCTMEPTGRPGVKKCMLLFSDGHRFKTFDVLCLQLMCVNMTNSTKYRPVDHIKLEAPSKPLINGSSISWTCLRIPALGKQPLEYQLQWRPHEGPWTDAWSKQFSYEEQCSTELQTDSLRLHHRFSARLRVRVHLPATVVNTAMSAWSDWGPSASWESLVGRTEETSRPESDGASLWTFVAVGATAFTLIVVFIFVKTTRLHWVYMIEMIKGEHLPKPAESILKMSWQKPPFSSESYMSFRRVDIIASVELSDTGPRPKPETPLLEENPNPQQPLSFNLSSFSNPMYPQLCPTAPSADSPYGPKPDPPGDVERHSCPQLDMLLFLTLTQQCQGVPVICEYEKVEAVRGQKEQGERVRLHSEDSGVGSGEEVSQDSLLLEDQTVTSQVQDQTIPTHSPGQLLHRVSAGS